MGDSKRVSFVIYVIALLCLLLVGVFARNYFEADAKLKEAQKLQNALRAEMIITKDELGRETATKLTLQASVSELEAIKNQLSTDKKELLAYVKTQDKNKQLIVAAITKTEVKAKNIDSGKPTLVAGDSIKFAVVSDTISYGATVSNVRPANDSTAPRLRIDSLLLPNKSYISFHWGDKKEGYPISVSVMNSNPLFKTSNIESYAIPELQKKIVRPTFLEKVGNGLRIGGTPLLIGVGVGVVGGVLLSGALH